MEFDLILLSNLETIYIFAILSHSRCGKGIDHFFSSFIFISLDIFLHTVPNDLYLVNCLKILDRKDAIDIANGILFFIFNWQLLECKKLCVAM